MKKIIMMLLILSLLVYPLTVLAETQYKVGDIVEIHSAGYGASDGTGGRMAASSGIYEIKRIASGRWVYYPYGIGPRDKTWIDGWVSSDMISLANKTDSSSSQSVTIFTTVEWFDYFFTTKNGLLRMYEKPSPRDSITFELQNNSLVNVNVSQTEYTSNFGGVRYFSIIPKGCNVDITHSCVYTFWTMESKLDAISTIVSFMPIIGDTVDDLISRLIDSSITTNRMNIKLKYTILPSGTVQCEIVDAAK